MDIKTLVKELIETEAASLVNLDGVDRRVYASHQIAKAEATEKYTVGRALYQEQILKRAVGIFLIGSPKQVQKYIELAKEVSQDEIFTVDAAAMYREFAAVVEASLGDPGPDRQSTAHQMAAAQRLFRKTAAEFKLTYVSTPEYYKSGPCPDAAATVSFVRDMLRLGDGDYVNCMVLARNVTNAAWAIRYMGNVMPVMVVGALVEEFPSLSSVFGKGSTSVILNENTIINQEFIIESFKSIRKPKHEVNSNPK